ncbi:MAG TPA: MupA/Atu3671 family FMN-dependent luciferase-like monooxygenase [Pyrinomonadaceae bacterium]
MRDLVKSFETPLPGQREFLELQLGKKQHSRLAAPNAERVADEPAVSVGARQSETADVGASPEHNLSESIQFSLFFFSDDGSTNTTEKYQLLLETAKFADAHDFKAVWTPERHFQDFGGLYPNPSVLGAALAMVTEKIELRAGSVNLPLHNPIRVAEEWSVVDNLSHGRVAVSFASDWHPLDFVFHPEGYQKRKELLFQQVSMVKDLWAGRAVALKGVDGQEVEVKILPRPIQPKLPTWITVQGNHESWIKAGEIGANVLTAIVTQPLAVLAEKIKLYRETLANNGHDPAAGRVAVMLHTFLGDDDEIVKEQVRVPLAHYFRTNIKQLELQKDVFLKVLPNPTSFEIQDMTEADLDAVADYAFESYFNAILLCGTPAKCSQLVDGLMEIGVNEIACLIDFGLPLETIMEGLHRLNILRKHYTRMSV